eukprot:gene9101-biopygen6091
MPASVRLNVRCVDGDGATNAELLCLLPLPLWSSRGCYPSHYGAVQAATPPTMEQLRLLPLPLWSSRGCYPSHYEAVEAATCPPPCIRLGLVPGI